jgi:hypothetical protein
VFPDDILGGQAMDTLWFEVAVISFTFALGHILF